METIIEATLAERGQVVIPKAVRDRMRFTPGAKLNFVVDGDGNVTIRRPLAAANFQKWVGTFEANGASTSEIMEELRRRPFPWTGSADDIRIFNLPQDEAITELKAHRALNTKLTATVAAKKKRVK